MSLSGGSFDDAMLRDLKDVARARAQYARADRLVQEDRPDLAEKARARGWEILRQVLERHPWRPKRIAPARRKHPSDRAHLRRSR